MGVLKPRTTSVVIYQGDDLEQLAELNRAVRRAEAALPRQPSREGATACRRRDPVRRGRARGVQTAYNAFVDEAAERAVVVTLTAIGRTRWRNLLAEHPPRTVHEVDGKAETIEDDQVYEVNTETFPMALLTYSRDGIRPRRSTRPSPRQKSMSSSATRCPTGTSSAAGRPPTG
jgi:hypothetical protein